MLLQLLQLLDDLVPQCGLDRVADLVHLNLHHQQVVAAVPGIDQRLQPTRRDDAGVHIDPGVRVDKVLITF